MRLLVDASAAVNQGAGIGRYARSLLPLLARGLPEADIKAVIAPDAGADPEVVELGRDAVSDASFDVRQLPFSRRMADIIWFRARLPLISELFAGRRDLVYSPDFTVPPSARGRSIITVHDLAFEIVPQYAPEGLRRYLQSVVPRQVKKATAIAVVSRNTAHDLQDRYGVSPDRITLVSNGVDDRFFAAKPPDESARIELGIPADYLLMVGTLEPRKNHLGALDALLRSEVGREVPLVVAGRRGWADEAIVERLRQLEANGRVIWLKYAPERLLPSLYAGALATIYPSWYEGFGIPALESLAAGTPLVVSRAPSLIEIAHSVAREADAGNPDEIAAAIDDAVRFDRTDDARKRRKARAALYRWESSGQALVQLIQRTVA